MFATLTDAFENYQDNRDSYSIQERTELRKYFREALRLQNENSKENKPIF